MNKNVIFPDYDAEYTDYGTVIISTYVRKQCDGKWWLFPCKREGQRNQTAILMREFMVICYGLLVMGKPNKDMSFIIEDEDQVSTELERYMQFIGEQAEKESNFNLN